MYSKCPNLLDNALMKWVSEATKYLEVKRRMNRVFVAAIFSSFLCKQDLSDYDSKMVNKTSPNPVCRYT